MNTVGQSENIVEEQRFLGCQYPKQFTIIIMYIYCVLINALSAHMININLNTTFCTLVQQNPANWNVRGNV